MACKADCPVTEMSWAAGMILGNTTRILFQVHFLFFEIHIKIAARKVSGVGWVGCRQSCGRVSVTLCVCVCALGASKIEFKLLNVPSHVWQAAAVERLNVLHRGGGKGQRGELLLLLSVSYPLYRIVVLGLGFECNTHTHTQKNTRNVSVATSERAKN